MEDMQRMELLTERANTPDLEFDKLFSGSRSSEMELPCGLS